MGGLPALYLSLSLTVGAPPATGTAKAPARPLPGGELSAEDARYLDHLIDEFLFDPRGATRVRIGDPEGPREYTIRNGRLSFTGGDGRDGWLVRGTGGRPDRIYFTDGESVPAAGRRARQIDFEALCERRYLGDRVSEWNDVSALVYRLRTGGMAEPDLAQAAWLHRRGYDGLAARALAMARAADEDPRAELRDDLARRAYDGMVEAFCGRADADAMAHGERLFRLYPDVAVVRFPQSEALFADLKRRQKAGTFGKPQAKDWPAGFAEWAIERKVAFLVESLDEVETGPTNAWEFNSDRPENDRRVAALVALGDAAIPALIDVIDRDERLVRHRVRQVRFQCGFARGGRGFELDRDRAERVVSVRTVAEGAVRLILKVRSFDPAGTDALADDSGAATAVQLRRYWATYGRLAFPDRMMALLTDPAVQPAARQEAAESLVSAFPADPSGWTRRARGEQGTLSRPSPLAFRYRSPTVAEAILAALDRDRAVWPRPEKGRRDSWVNVETAYLDRLVALGDPRIGPELARRAEAADQVGSRVRFAMAAHALGVSGPVVRLAREVEAGMVRIQPALAAEPCGQTAPEIPAEDLVDALIDARLPEAEAALYAAARPGHPFYPVAERATLWDPQFINRSVVWKRHPLFLTVLQNGLADTRPTGGHYYLRGDEIQEWAAIRRPRNESPIPLGERGKWAEHVETRVADEAADRLSILVVGMPEYHALRKDAEQVRAAMRSVLDRHAEHFRRLTPEESSHWDDTPSSDVYVPDIRPLGRPATAADVRAGRAVFDLGGAGKVADVRMPSWLILKTDAKRDDAPAGLIVQAEVGPDGKVVYGVIFRHAIRAVKADEVGRIEPYTMPVQAQRWSPPLRARLLVLDW
jgi:hypothetical protein